MVGIQPLEEAPSNPLPYPVENWIRNSGISKAGALSTVKLDQDIRMKMEPGQEDWQEASADQLFTLYPPAFNWSVKLGEGGLMPIVGRDRYGANGAEMQIKLFGLFPVVDVRQNDKLDQGTLQRYLAEIVWFPSAALTSYIEWEPLENRETSNDVHLKQVYNSIPSYQFLVILGVSAIIGTFGLVMNSSVVIIGAMLIAPLMKPIISVAYGIVLGERDLKVRSLITIFLGMIVTVCVAAIVESILGLYEPTEEILSRISPSLIDLGIAIAAGIAATFASTRKNIMDSLPGVAIAVSLVPPLCVTGIGWSIGSLQVFYGSLMLFLVNLVAIILTSVIVFLLDGFGKLKNTFTGLSIVLVVAFLQLFPLSWAMESLEYDDQAQQVVEKYFHERYEYNQLVHPDDLEKLNTMILDDHVSVFLEIKAEARLVDNAFIDTIHARLSNKFEIPVNLIIQVLDAHTWTKYSYYNPDGSPPKYGTDVLVPKR